MTSTNWTGRNVERARRYLAPTLPTLCPKCRRVVEIGDDWNVGHKVARWSRPDLANEPGNWQVEHRRCSDSSGQAERMAKAANGVRRPFLGGTLTPRESRPSLDTPPSRPEYPRFDPTSVEAVPWLRDLVELRPESAAWPRAMTPAHPEAVGSYGIEVEEWVRDQVGVEFRWWQRLATRRQLEHRDDGSLCWQNVIESTPRRAGKSVRLRCLALWRTASTDRFGETQLVLHTGKDLPICKEIHRQAWRWAEIHGWTVRRQNGNEEVEHPDGSRWIVRGSGSVYGYDVCLGMVDEAWSVDATVVDDGLEPAMLERVQPQLLLTSTAHRRATSLMRRRLGAALAGMGEDFSSLVLWWASDDDDDLTDPATWRSASPHWTPERHAMIEAKLERALRGEADPDADDPDPVEGFKAQYLNLWPPPNAPRMAAGEPVMLAEEWADLVVDEGRPAGAVSTVAAVESWFSQGVAVAYASPVDLGRVCLSVESYPTVEAAASAIPESVRTVLVGKSIAGDPAWLGLPVKPVGSTSRQSVTDLRRLVDADVVRHDGSPVLTNQVLDVRVSHGPDGPRVKSTGRLDAVKAAAWAATEARVPIERPRIF